jgi:hypothetical protein
MANVEIQPRIGHYTQYHAKELKNKHPGEYLDVFFYVKNENC